MKIMQIEFALASSYSFDMFDEDDNEIILMESDDPEIIRRTIHLPTEASYADLKQSGIIRLLAEGIAMQSDLADPEHLFWEAREKVVA